jgi:perosamine synthetase
MIPLFKAHIPENIGQILQPVFDSGMVTEGRQSDQFRQMFSDYINNQDTNIVNSGTSALTLAYLMAGVGPGDEVISTPMTCMATNEPIFNLGAKIVWADIDPDTGNIDPESVKQKITKKTKAIVGVHWAGYPFEIEQINKIAKENNLYVIEDAAHALGSKYNNKLIGSHSDFTCFSFQAIKHLTTIDGGAISAISKENFDRIKKIKWFGLDRDYVGSKWSQDISESGYKFHMNNINSSIGIEQMKFIDNIILSHKKNYKFYNENIINKKVTKMRVDSHIESSCWIYTVLVDDKIKFKTYLESKGISSDEVHVRNDKYSVFKHFYDESLKNITFFNDHHINIPVGWWISQTEIEIIVEAINEYK